jgi:hypothetical protein
MAEQKKTKYFAPLPTGESGIIPTYGEFMAQKNAANAAADITAGNTPMSYAQASAEKLASRTFGGMGRGTVTTTYAENAANAAGGASPSPTGTSAAAPTTTYAANTPPEGVDKGISFAPTAETGTTYAENAEGGKTVLQLIEEQKNASYAEAEAARERAIVDAKTSYAQNKATYGASGERLATQGMAGSGYGEYLDAAAYAQQRADVQAARATETAAKNAAERVYYGDMAAETARQEAEQKAQTEKAEAQTAQKNAAYAALLDAAKRGGYTAEEIRNLAQRQGITDESDIEMLTKAAGDASAEKEKSDIAGNVTADMSDEKIAELYPNSQEEAKAQRTEAAAAEISALVDSGDITGADKLVEQYYKSGVYSEDERQNYYMDQLLDKIDGNSNITDEIGVIADELVKAKNNGKISEDDYRKAMQYASEKATSVLISGDTSNFTQKVTDWGNEFSITINGKEYKGGLVAKASDDAGGNIQNILDNAMGGYPKEGSIALYDDGVYVYAKVNGKAAWYKASRNMWIAGNNIKFATDNKNIYKALQAAARTRKDPKKPEHKAG